MEELSLRTLKLDDEKSFLKFVEEFLAAGEKPTPASISLQNISFKEWLKNANDNSEGKNLAEGRVPSTLYFLFSQDESKILGSVEIRHELNDYLLKVGGNIGYGVAPSERKKGYANFMLAQSLGICRKMGMKKVLVTCNKENIGSSKTILKNSGVLENEVLTDDGFTRQRYWINL